MKETKAQLGTPSEQERKTGRGDIEKTFHLDSKSREKKQRKKKVWGRRKALVPTKRKKTQTGGGVKASNRKVEKSLKKDGK